MNTACEWVQEHASALVRGDAARGDAARGDAARRDAARGDAARRDATPGDTLLGDPGGGGSDGRDLELPGDVAAHLDGCPTCRELTERAKPLRSQLDAWVAPEPKEDLVERTLARLALASPFAEGDDADAVVPTCGSLAEAQGGAIPDPTPAPAFAVHEGGKLRRSSIMILTGTREDELGSGSPPSSRRLLARLCMQAAAAAVLFVVCTTFVAVFYPAVTFALEERRVKRCQEQLGRLSKAAAQYHREHPEAASLHGRALRKALILGGYADELDFVCTGHSGQDLLARSYVGMLPRGDERLPADRPVIWDRFANHSSGFNVAYPDGRVETVSVDKFDTWRQRRRGE